jgi:hypothetical protein
MQAGEGRHLSLYGKITTRTSAFTNSKVFCQFHLFNSIRITAR